jgi:hypothetical protein
MAECLLIRFWLFGGSENEMGLHLPVGLDLLNLRMAHHSTTTRKLRPQGEMLKVPLRRAERTYRTKTSFSDGPEVCPFSVPSNPKEVA